MSVFIFILAVLLLLYNRASLKVFTLSVFVLLCFHSLTCALIFLAIALPFNITQIRAQIFSRFILTIFKKQMPHISETEKAAIEAGDIWWEAALFTGMPDFTQLQAYPKPTLSAEEQAFIDHQVRELCDMIDDWQITSTGKIPDDVWDFMKKNGFFSLIIPKTYGGKAFSALAHSEILAVIASRSLSMAATVSVPNSLGPGELLLHYGTPEQKDYYLPRLAKGLEVPCFALTGPEAGSDAGSIPDTGIVCRGEFEGKQIIGLKLNWDKRYITLAPVATLLGLAFKLYDPDKLLSDQVNRGITCALIPVNMPGITIGHRHMPLNMAFPNGPTQGHDVFVPLDFIIGGEKMIGQGWRMLVECLSAGRALSLPSLALGGARAGTFATFAYAHIRQQFGEPIGYFEGVEEALVRMAGFTYIIESARLFTAGAVDLGLNPSVPSAIVKYHATELSRKVSLDAMDIHGGKGICLGPHNYLGRFYQGVPVAITVEGANILTRTLMIFGQGAIRAHPYLLTELRAAEQHDLKDFDKAIFAHAGFILSNIVRTFCLTLTCGYANLSAPRTEARRYYQQITRLSSAFALSADLSLILLGGRLKRLEKLSGRLADVLSMLYLTSAVLKRYHDEHTPDEKLLLDWSCKYLLNQLEIQLSAFWKNYPNRLFGFLMRKFIFPFGICMNPPSDQQGHLIAKNLLNPGSLHDLFKKGLFLQPSPGNLLADLETTLLKCVQAEELEKRIKHALKAGEIHKIKLDDDLQQAKDAGIITDAEFLQVRQARAARRSIIAVDDFMPNIP
ncbi:MAG: acyl-CoA dehydrogenase [Legionellales bacterium]|jgi:acyl-CoA dehydrogenase